MFSKAMSAALIVFMASVFAMGVNAGLKAQKAIDLSNQESSIRVR